MSTKMSFVLGFWLLCGFFANLPTASSIECYACGDYPGSTDPCDASPPAIQCESYFDSCSTINTTVEFYGVDSHQTEKNCSIEESPGCNQTYICELVNQSVVAAGGQLLQCDVSCCKTDRCNGQNEGEANSTTPVSGPQSELKYYIETVRGLLDEMEYIVDNDLEDQLSTTEYQEHVKEVLNEFYAAITNEEKQSSNSIIDELKTNAAELMKKMETKGGQKKIREAKTYQLLSDVIVRKLGKAGSLKTLNGDIF